MTVDTTSTATPPDLFSRLVQKWSDFGPPLRPSPDDTAVVQRLVADLGGSTRAVVLGLTPEIIGCDWPQDVDLAAVDHSQVMMNKLWPPTKCPSGSRAILANWCAMPITSDSIDLVVGDGCYMLLTNAEGARNLTKEICRILRPGGKLVIRVFLRPEKSETVAEIAHALGAGTIGSVHALKLRLLAALHDSTGSGTRLDDVWHAWKTMPSIPVNLAGMRGWSDGEIAGLEKYRGMDERYFLPTLPEIRKILASQLAETECAWGGYELADRCPTLVLTRDR